MACVLRMDIQYHFEEDTWIGANLPDIANADNLDDINYREWHKYVYSLYWSITTMTTVGYGDFSPKNITEVIFASACMLFNIALNAYILGAHHRPMASQKRLLWCIQVLLHWWSSKAMK